ncbi:MAG: hypothetical protein V3U18_06110 [Alphaproteobacteria bacterium]
MPLWRLMPLDLTDPNWQASSHRGRVVVRAPDEEGARNVAAEAFDVPTRFKPGQGVLAPPWRRPSLVRVELIEDERYDLKGPTEILDPSL